MEDTSKISDPLSPVSVVSINKLPVVFVMVVSVVAVTVTSIVQVPRAATVIPVNDRDCCPSVSDNGEGDPQPVYVTVVPSISRSFMPPLDKSSVKLTLVMGDGPGLFMVKVRADVPPGVINLGENDLSMDAFTIDAIRPAAEKSLL